MNRQTKKRFLTISVRIAVLAILLAFLAYPRTSTEIMALEALPSESLRQQLTDQIAALADDSTAVGWDNVYLVTRSNWLGWQQTVCLIPVASLNINNLRTGGDRVHTASLNLLSTSTDMAGNFEQISIALDPGENISVRGDPSFILTNGGSTQSIQKTKSQYYTFDTPITALDLFWFAGIQEDDLVTDQTEAQVQITFQFSLSYAGQTAAEQQSLTVTQSFSLTS